MKAIAYYQGRAGTDWEVSLRDHLGAYKETGDDQALIPYGYLHPSVVRWQGQYIWPKDARLPYRVFCNICDSALSRYLADVDTIIEYGCGTGMNLVRLADLFPHKALIGYDLAVASQEILEAVHAWRGTRILPDRFDMLHPRGNVARTAGIFTVGALEQLGKNFWPFLEYLLEQRPTVCVHLEPIIELYDDDVLTDYLAKQYHRSRGYLEGFLPALRKLEEEGVVEILEVHHYPFGLRHHEAYTLIAWVAT